MHAPIPEDDGEGGMSGSGFDAEGVYSSKNDVRLPLKKKTDVPIGSRTASFFLTINPFSPPLSLIG